MRRKKMDKRVIKKWSSRFESGSKRTNIQMSYYTNDWFVGYGKEEGCKFEGTWWDMVCFARNILANENTKMACPEFYRPKFANDNYTGEEKPYVFKEDEESEKDGM